MRIYQHTIKEQVSVSGIGLHTGVVSTLTFVPAAPNHGIIFQRTDLKTQPMIHADVENVVDLSRGTSIEENGARVNTVEHTLAALVGLEIDNVLVQIDGPEPPILDGSAVQFIEALLSVGLEKQDAQRNFFEVTEKISFQEEENGIEISVLPLDDYRATIMIDYESQVLGSQLATLDHISDFHEEISSARTFCFLHEVEELYKNNLIKGGDLSNAIVIVEREIEEGELDYLTDLLKKDKVHPTGKGILNNVELRHDNEPARHKLLDVVGDLALVGRPIKGQIMAKRPGHAANIAFAKLLKEAIKKEGKKAPRYDPTQPAVCDIRDIQKLLPHRYPFLLVDKIIHLDSEKVCGIKNVTQNEPFFQGHFPGNPVFPGVLQIEAVAQVGGILAMGTLEDPENYLTYFLGIENFKFRKMVIPGDTLVMQCDLIAPIRRGFVKMKGVAYVGDQLVCEGTMTAVLTKKEA